jgi:hypothetical protein
VGKGSRGKVCVEKGELVVDVTEFFIFRAKEKLLNPGKKILGPPSTVTIYAISQELNL